MSTLDRWLRDGWVRPIDHALGATLLRLRPQTPEPVALAAALASRAVAFGHSLLPLDRVPELFAEIAPDRAPPALPTVEAWRDALLASGHIARGDGERGAEPLVFAHGGIALRRYHDYEVRLARALLALAGPIEPVPEMGWLRERLTVLFPRNADAEPDRQALAVAVAQLQRVLLLTGGPGTGKTTTVARVLALRVGDALRGSCASFRRAA